MPMDESLFLVPAPDTAGDAVDNFCLGVIHVEEVSDCRLPTRSTLMHPVLPGHQSWPCYHSSCVQIMATVVHGLLQCIEYPSGHEGVICPNLGKTLKREI